MGFYPCPHCGQQNCFDSCPIGGKKAAPLAPDSREAAKLYIAELALEVARLEKEQPVLRERYLTTHTHEACLGWTDFQNALFHAKKRLSEAMEKHLKENP